MDNAHCEIRCSECGELTTVLKSEEARDEPIFCSEECWEIYQDREDNKL